MWVCNALVKKRKLSRRGLVKNIILPKDKDLETLRYNLKIDNTKKEAYFEKGTGLFVITDEFGVSEKSDFTLFFIDKGVIIELHKGVLYLKGPNDKVYILSSRSGKVTEYLGNRDEVNWRDYSEMFDFCNFFTKSHYNIESSVAAEKYVDNLLFTLQSYYYLKENKLYSCTLKKKSEILGLKTFHFTVFEKKIVENMPNSLQNQMSSLEKEEVEYFKKSSKKMQNLDKEVDYKDLDDDDNAVDEDLDNISSDMHAVDIFNEYTPES